VDVIGEMVHLRDLRIRGGKEGKREETEVYRTIIIYRENLLYSEQVEKFGSEEVTFATDKKTIMKERGGLVKEERVAAQWHSTLLKFPCGLGDVCGGLVRKSVGRRFWGKVGRNETQGLLQPILGGSLGKNDTANKKRKSPHT